MELSSTWNSGLQSLTERVRSGILDQVSGENYHGLRLNRQNSWSHHSFLNSGLQVLYSSIRSGAVLGQVLAALWSSSQTSSSSIKFGSKQKILSTNVHIWPEFLDLKGRSTDFICQSRFSHHEMSMFSVAVNKAVLFSNSDNYAVFIYWESLKLGGLYTAE